LDKLWKCIGALPAVKNPFTSLVLSLSQRCVFGTGPLFWKLCRYLPQC